MAKHRRRKQEAPLDYGIILAGVAVIAGVFALIRWFRSG
ncbi:hypothetical protein DFR70_10330 [Nocardia tenerifensis]|uniref:Uncharacterized protein n=1 Tax=Nocardia tenerifensis TaxID=228006 RepID=A0A318K2M5_9NOCA|nr:hypothetical protein DFR70_10330 [Nocardia tenerifensis]